MSKYVDPATELNNIDAILEDSRRPKPCQLYGWDEEYEE